MVAGWQHVLQKEQGTENNQRTGDPVCELGGHGDNTSSSEVTGSWRMRKQKMEDKKVEVVKAR